MKSCQKQEILLTVAMDMRIFDCGIKTHSHVSAAKKDTKRTMCYLQEDKSS